MKDLRHTGDSANIAFYAEDVNPIGDVQIWAEILRDDFHHRDGRMQRRELPRFYITVYRRLHGQVARSRYFPRKPVPPGPLGNKLASQLVRRALKGT